MTTAAPATLSDLAESLNAATVATRFAFHALVAARAAGDEVNIATAVAAHASAVANVKAARAAWLAAVS